MKFNMDNIQKQLEGTQARAKIFAKMKQYLDYSNIQNRADAGRLLPGSKALDVMIDHGPRCFEGFANSAAVAGTKAFNEANLSLDKKDQFYDGVMTAEEFKVLAEIIG